ncbi:hypothetical protein CEE44_03995 [Candidatus Woesearchaeota archaeon B3_Woes]|nr:MAG: hypothetical protein CEE44_03995 [Candidatus Woesearchaeota archaeon B3_Woes]
MVNMPSEEEAKEMQEKIKNMSPEELKEFQAKNCVFCHIVEGKVNSKKIYDDEKCLAILDINPSNPGHILLLPKEHYAIMPLIPEDIIKHMFMISKQLSSILLKALKAQGINIFVANGMAAGQKAQHFMIHIIPRMEKDGLVLDIKGKKSSEEALEELRRLLVAKLNQEFGIETEEEVVEVEKPKVVDAEFEDKPKKKTTKKSSKSKAKKTKKQAKKESVSLDDIANLVTGGK